MTEQTHFEHAEKVFICMPLKPVAQDPQEAKKGFLKNIENAKIVMRYAVLNGYDPIVSTIYYTQFLEFLSEEEKVFYRKLSKELLELCDWIWIISRPDHQIISEEMRANIEHAEKFGLKKYWWWHDAVERMKDWLYYYDLIMNFDKPRP